MEHSVVGRAAELTAVDELLDSPGVSALVLDGEAGIGKTAIWDAGVAAALDRGYRILACRPAESEAALPFSALGDLLSSVLDEALPALPEPQRLALEVALQRVAPPEDPTDRLAVSLAVLTILRDLGSGMTTMALDDVQWLDTPSAQVLEFALRRLGDAPVVLLLSRRAKPDEPLPLGLDLRFPVRRLHVGPLSLDELDRLIVTRVGTQLSRPLLAQLHGASGGNPYFALEIVRAAADRNIPLESGAPLPIPENVEALLRRRIGALSAAVIDVLVLSAASPEPTAALLRVVTGSNEGLATALDAGMLELEGERLRFTHPLLASVAYNSADRATQRAAHARLAAAGRNPDDQALHLALAAVEPDEAAASELDLAASRLHRRGAPAAAAQLEEHACRLTPEDRGEELLVRMARSAEYHLAAGDTVRGRTLLDRVIDSQPPGPERARLLLRLGRVRYASDDVAVAHDLFGQALAEAGNDLRVTAEAEQAIGFTAIGLGDMPMALAHARSSLELAQRLNDPGLLALAFCRVAQTEFLTGEGLDRAALEQAVSLEGHIENVPVEWLPSYTYAGAAMFADDLETARRLCDGLHRAAVERGDERALPWLLVTMATRERLAGNWGVAGSYAVEAVQRSRQIGVATPQALALSEQALINALVGRVDESRAAAAQGLRIASELAALVPTALNMAALGFLELSLGDPQAAHRHLGPLSEMIVVMGLGEPGVVRFIPDEIEALVGLGEFAAAARLLTLLEERGRVLDRISARAAAARCRALLASAEGNSEAARAAVAEALAQHARLGQPFELGRTLLAQGTIQRRAKQRSAARESLTRALELFDALGAARWAEKAAAELARIPGRAPSAGGLSETQRRVAQLVCEGLSNKEIAARLFVSVRTVEANLSAAYATLGIGSRTELARRLAELDASQKDVDFHD